MAVALAVVDIYYTSRKHVVADLTFSGTYTTGGEVTTNGYKKDLGMPTKVLRANLDSGGAADTGFVPQYDHAADKIILRRTDQVDDFQEQLPNATAITGTIRAEFIGY